MKKTWKNPAELTLAAEGAAALLSGCGEESPKTTASLAKAILMVSFGTSYNESRESAIGSLEKTVTAAFPEYDVRRAFTSQVIIDKLKERDSEKIDNVKEAMERLEADGVEAVIVQPTHVMNGQEYDEMVQAVRPYENQFVSLKYGKPLLSEDWDYEEIIKILTSETADYNDVKTAVIYMGHGTEHTANSVYAKLQEILAERGYSNYYVGTVEAKPSLEEVMESVENGCYERVVLLPLMIVAGDHANNDMAGDGENSWKTSFKSEGYEVECILKGLGEYPGIQKMFVEHVRDAIGE